MSKERPRVLGVGSKAYLKELETLVRRLGYDFEGATNLEDYAMCLSGWPKSHYSCIISDISLSRTKKSRKADLQELVAETRTYDRFIPLIVLSDRGNEDLAFQSREWGATRYLSKRKTWKHNLKNALQKIFLDEIDLGNTHLIKLGGSMSDFFRYTHFLNVLYLPHILWRLCNQGKGTVCTVGTGQYGEPPKDLAHKHPHLESVQQAFPELMHKALESHALQARSLFGYLAAPFLGYDPTCYIDPERFHEITPEMLKSTIPFVTLAPPYVMRRDKIKPQDSDTNSMAIAQIIGADVILGKRVDGFYVRDPYEGFVPNPETGRCDNFGKWKKAQKGNKKLGTVTVDEFLEKAVRHGTNYADGSIALDDDHCLESSALLYFRDICDRVESISVFHIANEEMYEPMADGYGVHVVTGERINMPSHKEQDQMQIEDMNRFFLFARKWEREYLKNSTGESVEKIRQRFVQTMARKKLFTDWRYDFLRTNLQKAMDGKSSKIVRY